MTNTTFKSMIGITAATAVIGSSSPYCQPSFDFCLADSSENIVDNNISIGDYYFPYHAIEKNTELIIGYHERNHYYELLLKYLSSDELSKARNVIQIAVNRFPEDKDFVMAEKIISPPKFMSYIQSESQGIRETIAFLKDKGNEFNKKWIAVSKGQLLGVSDSYKSLVDIFDDKDVFITKVV